MEEQGSISRERMIPHSSVNRLPCEIKYNGSAPVTDYFVVNDDNKVKEAMFRGRLLKGERIALPEDVEGVMLVRKRDNQGNYVYEVAASFDEMTDWHADSMPITPSSTSISSCIRMMKLKAAMNEVNEQTEL